MKVKKSKRLKTAKDILTSHDWLENREKSTKYISTEHQDYGVRLAYRLNDPEHKSLYIKLAREEDRRLIENALSFTDDYYQTKNKARIFMWKLKQLRNARKEREQIQKEKQVKMF